MLRKMSDFIWSERDLMSSLNLWHDLFFVFLLCVCIAVCSWQLIKSYSKSNYRQIQ